jgi:hypothetical protein
LELSVNPELTVFEKVLRRRAPSARPYLSLAAEWQGAVRACTMAAAGSGSAVSRERREAPKCYEDQTPRELP